MILTPLNSLTPFAKASSGLWPAYAKHKTLLNGCVGLWAPCAGVQGGILHDFSGYGNHGTLTNMDPATAWATGTGGYSLDFDGTNDYVTIPDNDLYDVTNESFSVWFKATSSTLWRRLVGKGSDGSETFGAWIIRSGVSTGGKLLLQMNIGGSNRIITSTNVVTDGTWHNAVGTYDGSTQKLYVDGSEVGTNSVSGALIANSSVLYFGREAGGQYYSGQIDDVHVYNRALHANEVRVLYQLDRGGIFDLDETAILAALKSGTLSYPAVYRHCLRRLSA